MNEHEAMKLPEGKTCSDCYHYSRCSVLFGAFKERTSCDFYPRRFLAWPVEVPSLRKVHENA